MSARHASYRAASGGGALVAEGAAVLTVLDLFSGSVSPVQAEVIGRAILEARP